MEATPSPWPLAPLGELCRIELGSTPPRKSGAMWDADKATDNVWLTIADLPKNLHASAVDSKEYVSDLAAANMRQIPAGTLLVSFKLTLGRLAYAGRELFSNEAIASLLEVDDRRIQDRFLYWALSAFDWDKAAEGDQKIKGKTLNKAKLKRIPVPLPPLEEQRRIVAVLDEAFEGLDRARAHAEANLHNARELFSNSLNRAFNDETTRWIEAELADLGVIQTGSTPTTADPDNLGDFIPFIKPGDFMDDGSLVYDNQGLSKKGASVSRIVPPGSALMVCIGATIGKAGFADREITTNQQINSIIPRSGVSGEYLYHQMITLEFQAAVLQNAGQATLPIINKKKWSKLRVRMPRDPDIQRVITGNLRSLRGNLDQVQVNYRRTMSCLNDLRQSILQRAFAGELT